MKRFNKKLDCIFWWIIYALPIVLLIGFNVFGRVDGSDVLSLSSVFRTFGLNLSMTPIHTALVELFDIIQINISDGLVEFVDYFVIITVVHLVIDTLLFIPRFAHSLFDCFGRRLGNE